jgi:hydroxyacylglutathione hydrolase
MDTQANQPLRFAGAQISGEGVPEILPEHLLPFQKQVKLIDVRRPDEFTGELGHIEGATLATLESEFRSVIETLPRDKTYVFVCRSGGRSARATAFAMSLGFENAYNLQGGMMYWNSLGLPVVR